MACHDPTRTYHHQRMNHL